MSTLDGILIIGGIALTLLVLGFVGHLLMHRFGRTKAKSLDHEPHAPGRVGRATKQQGP